MSVLGREVAGASSGAPASAAAASTAAAESAAEMGPALAGPVVFSILDAKSGEVSILHGSSEVIVRDRELVSRIMRAARRAV